MSETGRRCISVMVPTYNEQENVRPLYEALVEQFRKNLPQYEYEILFIDNCSTDRTRTELRALCAEDKRVKAIFNARNFGQFSSPYYGLCKTAGDCAVSMCADFQDPVELLPVLVEKWEQGHAVVCAIKTRSEENKLVRFLRSCYYKLIRKTSSVEQIEHFTGFGLYDRRFLDVMRALDDPTPFLRGVVAELGFARCEVPYTQKRRRAGRTSNNYKTLYDAAMVSFTTYTKTPIRAMMAVGIFLLFFSVLGGTGCLFSLVSGRRMGLLPLGTLVLFLSGVQTIFLSVLGEYILMLRSKLLRRPLVIEQERINFEKER